MHHRSGQRKLNITDSAHRIAMLRNISNSLIQHEKIKTTLIRAKELRRFVEPLITLGKKPSVANRRLAFSRLRDRNSVTKLFDDLGIRFAERPGGYLRILKYGYRAGDSAPMALVELVERREEEETEGDAPAKSGKSAKSAKKSADAEKKAGEKAEEKAEKKADEKAEEKAPAPQDE